MFHSTLISKNGQTLHFIASGSLAFKMYSQILLDKGLQGYEFQKTECTLNPLLLTSNQKRNQLYFALISDLDKAHTDQLCQHMMEARVNHGYTIGEVLALDDDPCYFKSVKKMYSSFDEVIELNQFLVIDSQEMDLNEKVTFLSTSFTRQLVRVILNVSQAGISDKSVSCLGIPIKASQ